METKYSAHGGHPSPSSPNTPNGRNEGYEPRDINVPALLKLAFWLAVLLVVTLISMRWTLDFFAKTETLGPPAAPFTQARELPPGPRLQAAPHVDLTDYCVAQQKNVDTYSWVDQQQGTVRIPVDRAMDLILQRGLPVRPSSQAPATDLPGITVGAQNTQAASYLNGPCGYLADQEANAPKD